MLRGRKTFKLLDRYVGIPILVFLRLFKKKKGLPKEINTIGILTVPAIGDVILLNGLLRDIKKFNRNIRIILFVSREVTEAAELMDSCDEIINIELNKPLKTLRSIKKKPVDIFIDTSQWSRLNAILTFFSSSGYKIGFKTKGQCKHLIFDSAAGHSNQVHEFHNYKKLSFIKEMRTDCLPELKLKGEVKIKPKQVVIHIMPSGYLSELKEWPDKHWRRVIDYLLSIECAIFFTGSGSDYRRIQSIIVNYENNTGLHNIAGKFSMKETAILLKSSQLVISVNTGIMHLASVLGCNLIALHGPTNPERWGPLNTNSKIIRSDYPEAPCLNLGFEFNCSDRSGECMKRITPEAVIGAIREFGL